MQLGLQLLHWKTRPNYLQEVSGTFSQKGLYTKET